VSAEAFGAPTASRSAVMAPRTSRLGTESPFL
jgi:hypothetical protein